MNITIKQIAITFLWKYLLSLDLTMSETYQLSKFLKYNVIYSNYSCIVIH